ncbi:glycosyltransferase family 4 protein [Ornithinimicrobium faecis]|uniref:Glycosyltransferase family 4 protein n=1 Tax=Ornithinimicrobium faecis TaxID=2934158 RepID=A0ABY4YZ33_9MICO|nr:glycosyltransferase family 4 protein [Ornithinimicrobium sp. HY1793]USQ82006.1 glycosyltransferase family 4 protein [Ornithinimicrobium sp. HY1793]
MRIGIVCPYSFDVPGGVQLHIRDLAEYLLRRGHVVSVLAPADEGTELPDYVVSAGGAVPVRFNGSVARLSFGPIVANRVDAWLDDWDFDVLHLHEPAAPSLSLLALWAARVPIVATFHSSQSRVGTMRAAQPLLQPGLDKISARIAVSDAAHKTMASGFGGTTLVIPNGVYVDRFAPQDAAPEDAAPAGAPPEVGGRPRIVFLGRFDEPRKGLPVLLAALPLVLAQVPDAALFVAGPGDVEEVRSGLSSQVADAVHFLGMVSEEDKVALLAGANAYVAPNTGGESFGIILVEAMSAGAPVVASALDAFTAVIGDSGAGVIFPVGDHRALAAAIVRLLENPSEQAQLRRAGQARARRFDWSTVGARIEAVYDSVAVERVGDSFLRDAAGRVRAAGGAAGGGAAAVGAEGSAGAGGKARGGRAPSASDVATSPNGRTTRQGSLATTLQSDSPSIRAVRAVRRWFGR